MTGPPVSSSPSIHHPDRCPRGIIPRVEAPPKHREFVTTVCPPFILIKLTDARTLADRGETARSYFGPNTTVITTSTIADAELRHLRYTDELDILTRFEPDIHIPADRSVYERHDPSTRRDRIEASLEGYLLINEALTDRRDEFSDQLPATIPLLQGLTPDEYQVCFDVFTDVEAPMAAYYAVQYFTGNSPRPDDLLDTIHTIDHHAPAGLSVFVIGGLGTTLTDEYPERVEAAAGFSQWYGRLAPQFQASKHGPTLPVASAKTAYHELATTTNANLEVSIDVSHNPDYIQADTDPATAPNQ